MTTQRIMSRPSPPGPRPLLAPSMLVPGARAAVPRALTAGRQLCCVSPALAVVARNRLVAIALGVGLVLQLVCLGSCQS